MKEKNLTIFLVLIAIGGLALWGFMLILTKSDANSNSLFIHLGETGATLAVVTVLGGLARKAFDEWEKAQQDKQKMQAEKDQANRQEQVFYSNMLADFKSVYDLVESCRLLVEAHQSAKTYGDQLRNLTDGVVILHNIKRASHTYKDLKDNLEAPIEKMIDFIKALLTEFRRNYKRISHLQAVDEEWNKQARIRLAKEEKSPDAYEPLSRAWEEIQKLPRLTELRDDKYYEEKYENNFLNYLDLVTKILRDRLYGDGAIDKKAILINKTEKSSHAQ